MSVRTNFLAELNSGVTMNEANGAKFTDIPLEAIATFSVELEDFSISVDLRDGSFCISDGVGSERLKPFRLDAQFWTPLRLVYYKRMQMSVMDHEPTLVCFVVGWQTTDRTGPEWGNLKVGLKVYPAELRWELTEDI